MLLVTHELPDSGLFATQYSPLPVRVSPLLLGYGDVTAGNLLPRLDNDQGARLRFATCRNSQQDDNDRKEAGQRRRIRERPKSTMQDHASNALRYRQRE